MTEWQPIETAPKDGTEFIALHKPPYGASGNHVIAFWHEYLNEPGFIAAGSGLIVSTAVYTRWMPLPRPPVALPLAAGSAT